MAKENSLKSQIYTAVFQSIISGEIPTDSIISEKSLVERYHVSKSPVREALVELCSEGVLRSIPRYGYAVVRLGPRDVRDILAFRAVLEPGCLAGVLEKITPEQLEELSELDRLCGKEASPDFWTHWENNKEFHLRLMACCGNAFAYGSLKKALDTLTRAYAQFYWDRWEQNAVPTDTRNHAIILEGIREKDRDKAVKALRADLDDFGMEQREK